MTKLFDLLQRCYSVEGKFVPKCNGPFVPHAYSQGGSLQARAYSHDEVADCFSLAVRRDCTGG
jgi:hypothetical protein